MTQTTTPQRRDSTRKSGTYDVYIEIDCDCEELLDAIGLDYDRSELDDTQNEICLSLDKDEYSDLQERCDFNATNEQFIGCALLNHELGEYVTKVTIYTPSGDKITFE